LALERSPDSKHWPDHDRMNGRIGLSKDSRRAWLWPRVDEFGRIAEESKDPLNDALVQQRLGPSNGHPFAHHMPGQSQREPCTHGRSRALRSRTALSCSETRKTPGRRAYGSEPNHCRHAGRERAHRGQIAGCVPIVSGSTRQEPRGSSGTGSSVLLNRARRAVTPARKRSAPG
jgi:hypothetical protein